MKRLSDNNKNKIIDLLVSQGDDEHRKRLLKNYQLDNKTKIKIGMFAHDKTVYDELLKHKLDHQTKERIAVLGTSKNHDDLIANHDLDDRTKDTLVRRANHNQLSQLLQKHNLNYDQIHHLRNYNRNFSEEHKKILKDKYGYNQD